MTNLLTYSIIWNLSYFQMLITSGSLQNSQVYLKLSSPKHLILRKLQFLLRRSFYSFETVQYLQIMPQLNLTAKKYITDRQNMEQYECFICYELTQNMRICKGPCAKPYCLKCIGRIKCNKDMCPSKCSQPFLTENIPHLKVQYHCPYQPQTCKLSLHNVQDFQKHCQECAYVTPEGLKEIHHKKQFLCDNGHQLSVVTRQLLQSMNKCEQPFYKLVMNDLCVGCGGRNLCRSICVPCSQQNRYVYCIDCRKVPFTKKHCSKGHPYTHKDIMDNYVCVCDRCGISACLKGDQRYFDQICDLVLCKICYQEIPESKQQQEKQKAEWKLQLPQMQQLVIEYMEQL